MQPCRNLGRPLDICLLLFALAGHGAVVRAGTKASYYLVENGESSARIVIPGYCGPATRIAALELQLYLRKMSGATLPIEHAKANRDHTNLILEVPKLTGTEEVSAQGTEDGFTIWGNRANLTIRGNTDNAVLYGAYQFLADLGVRWYMPGEIGEDVPARKTVVIPQGRKSHAPSFRTRCLDYSGYNRTHFADREDLHRAFDLWVMRNKLHFIRSLHWRPKLHRYNCCWTREMAYHNLARIVARTDIKAEPERFALVTGKDGKKQRQRRGAQICFTDPRNIKGAAELAKAAFRKDPWRLTYQMGNNDCAGFCECDRCVEANGGRNPARDPNEVVWKFLNAVCEELREEFPQKRIGTLAAYGLMTAPPPGFKASNRILAVTCHVACNAHNIDDPSCPFNRQYSDRCRRIAAAGAEMGSYDYTMFDVTPQPFTIVHAVKWYHQQGYKLYEAECMGRDEFRNIYMWCMAQLLWDAKQDPDALLREFCDAYYGEASADVQKILRAIHEKIASLPKLIIGGDGITQSILSPGLVDEVQAVFKRAKGKVAGIRLKRLRRLQTSFEVAAQVADIERAYYRFLDERAEKHREAGLKACDQLAEYWKKNRCEETMSSRMPSMIDRWRKRIKGAPSEVAPKDVSGLTGDAILDKAFRFADRPDKLDDLLILPLVWKFKPDLLREGVAQGWAEPELDDSGWHSLAVTDYYERQGFGNYNGCFWYRVRFEAPKALAGKKVFLRIGSLDDEGTIFVNGQTVLVRYHLEPDHWQSSFELEITEAIKPGETNVIAVMGNDEYGVGGVWNPCVLYTRP